MPEIPLNLRLSAGDFARLERLAHIRKCSIDDAAMALFQEHLATLPEMDADENIFFFPGFEIGEADGHSS